MATDCENANRWRTPHGTLTAGVLRKLWELYTKYEKWEIYILIINMVNIHKLGLEVELGNATLMEQNQLVK